MTPHHLTLEAPDCYERLGTLAQMNPPVRDGAHRAASGRRSIRASSTCSAPITRRTRCEEKAKTYPETPSGMTGVQTLVPLMLDHVNAGRLSLLRFVDLTSAGPARLFGIARKGRIAVGYDADLTVVDLKRRETITNRWIKSRAGWTPYDGVDVTGWPVGTVRPRHARDVGGRTVRAGAWRGGAVSGDACGPVADSRPAAIAGPDLRRIRRCGCAPARPSAKWAAASSP